MKNQRLIIAVIGGNKCTKEIAEIVQDIGKEISKLGAALVCGG